MKYTTLELLCCPICKSMLSLSAGDGNGIILNGELHCSACDRSYPIEKGIVRFVDPQELEGPNRHFEHYYNRLAPIYSLLTKIGFLPFGGERKAREEILKHVGSGGKRTLEVSVGDGANLSYLCGASDLGEIFGIDISIGQLTRCQRLIQRRGWQVELFLALAESLPFSNDLFDTVLHIGGINFFSDQQRAIEEMIRVARPGGRVVIADEVDRLAKRFNRSLMPEHGDEAIETVIYKLVPGSMKDISLEGIWKMHGQDHGYCVAFTKPA